MFNGEGFSEEIEPLLKQAVLKPLSSGGIVGERLVRGDEHRFSDEKVKREKQEKLEAKNQEGKQKAKTDVDSMLSAIHAFRCEPCSRIFVRKFAYQQHATSCAHKIQQAESASTKASLPSADVLAHASVVRMPRVKTGAGTESGTLFVCIQ